MYTVSNNEKELNATSYSEENACPEAEFFHANRAAFLEVPLDVVLSKRQFDLIRVLRKKRVERLALQEEECQKGICGETLIRVQFQEEGQRLLFSDSSSRLNRKRVLKKRKLPTALPKQLSFTSPALSFQEDDCAKTAHANVLALKEVRKSLGAQIAEAAAHSFEAATQIGSDSEASDLLTSFEHSDAEDLEVLAEAVVGHVLAEAGDSETASTNTGGATSSSEVGESSFPAESDSATGRFDVRAAKFGAGVFIPVRELVKIVDCEILADELFRPVRLEKPLNLSTLMRVANAEWECLDDIDCQKSRENYQQQKIVQGF